MNFDISHNTDDITKSISHRISKLVGIPLENAESIQVVEYKEGGEYRPHYDSWISDNSKKTLRLIKYGGFRLSTALVYLNDVESGGETKFTKLDLTVKPSFATIKFALLSLISRFPTGLVSPIPTLPSDLTINGEFPWI